MQIGLKETSKTYTHALDIAASQRPSIIALDLQISHCVARLGPYLVHMKRYLVDPFSLLHVKTLLFQAFIASKKTLGSTESYGDPKEFPIMIRPVCFKIASPILDFAPGSDKLRGFGASF